MWYIDDASAIRKLANVHRWWTQLHAKGTDLGLYDSGVKTRLGRVKPGYFISARVMYMFGDTTVNITLEGQLPYYRIAGNFRGRKPFANFADFRTSAKVFSAKFGAWPWALRMATT